MTALQRLGSRLREDVAPLVARVTARFGAELEIAPARGLTQTELEDHLLTFVSDLFLVVMAAGEEDRATRQMGRDSTQIQRLIAELHGRQRRRLGWTANQLEREYAILHAELQTVVHRRGSDDPAACTAAAGLLARLVANARRDARHGYRLATAETAGGMGTRPGVELRG